MGANPEKITITNEGLTVSKMRSALGISDPPLQKFVLPRLGEDIPQGRRDRVPGPQIQRINTIVEQLREDGTLPRRRINVEILFDLK